MVLQQLLPTFIFLFYEIPQETDTIIIPNTDGIIWRFRDTEMLGRGRTKASSVAELGFSPKVSNFQDLGPLPSPLFCILTSRVNRNLPTQLSEKLMGEVSGMSEKKKEKGREKRMERRRQSFKQKD